MNLRINETLPIGEVGNLAYRGAKAVRKTKLLFYRLVGAVFNCAYSVRLEAAPTGLDKSGSKPRGESVYLFLESTINASVLSRCESRPTIDSKFLVQTGGARCPAYSWLRKSYLF